MELLFQADLLTPEALPLLLLALGLALSVAEAIAPGANFIVVGIALLGAGLVGLVFSPLASPFALALVALFFGAIAFYGYRELDLYGGKGQQQTRDSGSLIGTTGRVTETVTETEGVVKLSGGGFNPHYSARSIDGTIPEGSEVMVVDPGGGNVLTVESLSAIEDDIDRELAAGRDAIAEADASNADLDEEAGDGSESGNETEAVDDAEVETE